MLVHAGDLAGEAPEGGCDGVELHLKWDGLIEADPIVGVGGDVAGVEHIVAPEDAQRDALGPPSRHDLVGQRQQPSGEGAITLGGRFDGRAQPPLVLARSPVDHFVERDGHTIGPVEGVPGEGRGEEGEGGGLVDVGPEGAVGLEVAGAHEDAVRGAVRRRRQDQSLLLFGGGGGGGRGGRSRHEGRGGGCITATRDGEGPTGGSRGKGGSGDADEDEGANP